MKSFYSAALLCLAMLMLAACGKKGDTPVPTKAPTELLAGTSSKTWAFKNGSLTAASSPNQPIDVKVVLQACDLDNMTIFKANGTVLTDEGATKCSVTTPQLQDKGTWTLSTDGKKLTIKDSLGSNEDLDIVELTETTLTTRFVLGDKTAATTYTMSYTRK